MNLMKRTIGGLFLTLLWACSDYGFNKETPEVPEGDYDCFDTGYDAVGVEVDESCSVAIGGWQWQVEWEASNFETLPSSNLVAYTPLVGQLTDDNDDGIVDAADTPDVVFYTYDVDNLGENLAIRMHRGDSGEVQLVFQGVDHDGDWLWPSGGTALADIDGDAWPDIVGNVYDGASCYPVAITPGGELLWVADGSPLPECGHKPVVADLEGDGSVEVIYGARIYSAADGQLLAQGGAGVGISTSYSYPTPAVADLDGDGIQEVVVGNALYAPDGSSICETGQYDGYPAVADLDGDGLGEFVVTGGGSLRIFEHDCSYTAGWSLGESGRGGPASIADFDGDGEPEIAVMGSGVLAVYEPDGSLLWSRSTSDGSGSVGVSAFDFDGDGRSELVYADQTELYVVSGADGSVLIQDTTHDSGTCGEYPVIADVDRDGSAEIVVPNAGYSSFGDQRGVYVIGSVDDAWMGARPTWNQHAFSDNNIDDSLAVPASPVPSWPEPNTFRAATALSRPGLDATALVGEICSTRCDEGLQRVVLRVGNQGTDPLPAGVTIDVYAMVAGTPVLLDSAETTTALEPGETSPGVPFDLDLTYLTDRQIQVVVDGQNRHIECDEEDNTVLIEEGLCP